MITLKEIKKRTELSEVQRSIPFSEKLPDTDGYIRNHVY